MTAVKKVVQVHDGGGQSKNAEKSHHSKIRLMGLMAPSNGGGGGGGGEAFRCTIALHASSFTALYWTEPNYAVHHFVRNHECKQVGRWPCVILRFLIS